MCRRYQVMDYSEQAKAEWWKKLNLLCLQHRECTLKFKTTIFRLLTQKFSQHILLETCLGIILDENMSVAEQIKKICQSAYFQIRNISSLRKILSDDTALILVHALITSHLDNGNTLLYGITNTLLDKLQRTQNAAAHVLSKTR